MPRRRRVAAAEAPAQGGVGGGEPGGLDRGEGARWRPVTATKAMTTTTATATITTRHGLRAGWLAGHDLRKSGVDKFVLLLNMSTHDLLLPRGMHSRYCF